MEPFLPAEALLRTCRHGFHAKHYRFHPTQRSRQKYVAHIEHLQEQALVVRLREEFMQCLQFLFWIPALRGMHELVEVQHGAFADAPLQHVEHLYSAIVQIAINVSKSQWLVWVIQ